MEKPDKADLRKEFLAKRNALEPAERARSSSLIRQRVFQHSAWKNATVILCYVSFGSEAETHLLIQEALRFKKRVIVPLHDSTSKETPVSDLQRFGELGTTHRGILQVQPEFQRLVDPMKIELALTPGIVYDRNGGRIGFGGGYFDRLLPKMPKAYRMGLAFSSQIAETLLPLENHDVRMQAIATERDILEMRLR